MNSRTMPCRPPSDFRTPKAYGRLFAVALLLAVPPLASADQEGSVTCHLEIGPYEIREQDGRHRIQLEGFGIIGDAGKPRLPGSIIAVAIPPGARPAGVHVCGTGLVQLEGAYRIEPTPLARPLDGRDDAKAGARREKWRVAMEAAYSTDDAYPAEPGWFVRRAGFRTYNLVDIQVAPFRYHPKSGRLYLFSELTLRVDYQVPGETPGTAPAADDVPDIERTAETIIVNYEEARRWYQPADAGTSPQPEHDFVIVTLASLVGSVAPLADHEALKGRSPEVVTVEWIESEYDGYDRAARIRRFLRDKYPATEWGIRDVLLVGDYNDLPLRECCVDDGWGHPFSDFYYAELSEADADSWDLDGDHRYAEEPDDAVDLYSEVSIGRIPWSEADTVRHVCEKSIAFELNNDVRFKQNIMVLGAFFWADTDNAWLMESMLDQPWMTDWTATRMYEDNADYQSTFPHDHALNHDNVVDVWPSSTYCFVNWAGHGNHISAMTLGDGFLPFVRVNDSYLLNDDYPAIIWAVSCDNANSSSFNIAKAMIRYGAVGFVGAAQVAYGQEAWQGPEDGSSQTCDYWFTAMVTSGEMTQGEAHQWSMRKLYTDGLWDWPSYEMYLWTLYGNPDLGLGWRPVFLAAGPGPGADNPSEVRVWDCSDTQTPVAAFPAYGIDRFGVHLAGGDPDGDGSGEILTGPGPGAVFGPHVRGFEPDGSPLPGLSFLAYGTHRWGVKVAAGDINGNGADEIITGAGPGAVFGPHVRAFGYSESAVAPVPGVSYLAYGTPKWGVNVSAGDIDGDGYDEIITGPGPGAVYGPHVRGWNVDGGTATAVSGCSFFAYSTNKYGVNVTCGDVDGDGIDEIVTGPGPGPMFSAHVRGFEPDGTPLPGLSFFAWTPSGTGYGATVFAGSDMDGDGRCEIVVGGGPDPSAGTPVKVYRYDGSPVTEDDLWFSLDAFGDLGLTEGANVTAGRF